MAHGLGAFKNLCPGTGVSEMHWLAFHRIAFEHWMYGVCRRRRVTKGTKVA